MDLPVRAQRRARGSHRAPAPHRHRRRPRAARHRRILILAAAAAAAAAFGLPVPAGPPASAAPAGTVTFTGGCGVLGSGLAANSTPSPARVSVSAGAQVRFANQLGQPATLRLDGDAVAQVPSGGVAEVVFHRGPVTATMQISCLLGSQAGRAVVEVDRAGEPQPEPSGTGGSPSPSTQPSLGTQPSTSSPAAPQGSPIGGSPGGSSSPSLGGGSAPAGGTGSERAAGGEGRESRSGGDPAPAQWWPSTQPPPAVTTGPDDAAEGHDGGQDRDGALASRWGMDIGPASGGGIQGDPATVDTEPAPAGPATDRMSRTAGSTSDDGPIGLLALIATVCVVGASAGAVRTLASRRAGRAEWA